MGVVPRGLAEMPTLRDDCYGYWVAFRSLSDSRYTNETGKQPIQVSEIQAYLGVAGVEDPYEKIKFLRIAQQMDQVALSHD